MPICYVVPGLGGTTLGYESGGGAPLWVDYTRIALGQIGAMRLAADGISPASPDGVKLFAGEPLPDYYATCIGELRRQLSPLGYEIVPWGYDWRLSARVNGPALAARIIADVTAGDPCSVVAHSFGGLVARVAWSELLARGQTGLVRRIVTLGSPHLGSYGAVALWSLDSDQLAQVRTLTVATATVLSAISPIIAPFPWSRQALVRLSATWPSLYETLPFLLGPDGTGDPYRSVLYGSRWPEDRGISQAWLDYARQDWQPFASSMSMFPPADVATAVAGTGFPTPYRLVYPGQLGNDNAYERTSEGDNAVGALSALSLSPSAESYSVAHADLPNQLALSGRLAALVTAARPGPPPPPPPAVLLAGANPVLAGPPSPDPRFSDGPC
jgi:Putative serine esterase (DUF676)